MSMESQDYLFRFHQAEDALPSWSQGITIVYLFQGKGTIHLEGELFESRVSENDLFVINDFQLYHFLLEENSEALLLLLSPHFFDEVAPEYHGYEIECKSYLYPENQQHYFDLIRKDLAIAFQLRNKNPKGKQVQIRSRLAVLLADLLEYFGEKTAPLEGTHTARMRLKEVIRNINAEYHTSLSLQSLAEEHYISTAYLSRLFQQELGITYTEYLTRVRLLHAKKRMFTQETFTDIAQNTGFPSANAMIDAFRKDTGMTPSQYRETLLLTTAPHDPLVPERSISFDRLFQYAQQELTTEDAPVHGKTLSIDLAIPAKPKRLFHKWKRILNAGYAAEILTHEVRQQLHAIQEQIGFRYLRFRGVLDDDMQVYHERSDGTPFFNFVKVNDLIDLILELGFTPFVEFSYMPALLSGDAIPLFRGVSRPSMPTHLGKWTLLIQALLKNFTDRYGISQVHTWMFSFFNSIDMADLGYFSKEEYLSTYAATYRAVKQLDSQLLLCGPGTMLGLDHNLEVFLEFCTKQDCLPDLLSFHCYHGEILGQEEGEFQLRQETEAFPIVLTANPDFLSHEIHKLEHILARWNIKDIPYFLDEWSNTIWQRDLTNDTSYKSAFLFKNILENYDALSGMSYWSASDYLSELPASPEIFHGGFGLLTRGGIPKSAFRAYELLAMMGNQLLAKGDGYFVSKKNDTIQIYLYNYAHYDTLYRYRHTQNIGMSDRYGVYEQSENQLFNLRLDKLPFRRCRVDTYSIGPEGGSTYDVWVSMGAPTHTTAELIAILERESYPVFHTETIDTTSRDTLRVLVTPHQIKYISITPL